MSMNILIDLVSPNRLIFSLIIQSQYFKSKAFIFNHFIGGVWLNKLKLKLNDKDLNISYFEE